LFLGLLLFGFQLFSQENYEIRRIKVKGNKAFDKSALHDQLTINSTNIYKRVVKKKEPSIFSKDLIDYELIRLQNFYQSEGYLYAEASIDTLILKDRKKKKRVDVYFLIEEGEYVTVNGVHFTFLGATSEDAQSHITRKVKKNLLLQHGKRFSDGNLYNDISTINDAYIAQGYVYVNTSFSLHLDEDSNTVDITCLVTPGEICQFGEVAVIGNNYTKECYIRKQFTFQPGDRYSNRSLERMRSQIYDLQNFRIVSISPQTNYNTRLNPVPIRITIQEIPRWTSKFGVGYGTEDQFRAFADVTCRGLFGGTSRLNLFAKYSSIYPYHVRLTWTEPRFFVRKLSLAVNPFVEKINDPAYVIQRLGVNVPLTYFFNKYFSMALTYYFERVKDETDYGKASVETRGSVKSVFYNKSGISTAFTFSNADPVTSPEKGWTVTIGCKVNGYIFGGEHDYFKYWVDVRKYFKIKEFTLAFRGMGGAVITGNGVPVEDRFYSGGANSNRGWQRSMLGPLAADGSPEGGNSIIEMNVEVRHPLFWRLELAAFTDFGNVWEPSAQYNLKTLEYTVGGGLRLNTPIGPIRIDIGMPIASENKAVRFVLSVGQAF
jgi:outer membrane protein insertion porin family